MDLTTKSRENIGFMLEKMTKKLQIVNTSIMKPEDYAEVKYEDLKYLYDHVMSKDHFSVNEIEGIIEELRLLKQ